MRASDTGEVIGKSEAPTRTSAEGRRRSGLLGRSRYGPRRLWLLVLPAAVFYLIVVIYPALRGAVEAFTNWNGILPAQRFIGFGNFTAMLHDPNVLISLRNIALIAVVVTIVQNGFGLLAALALHRKLKTRLILRAVLFAPVLINPLVMAYVWQYIFVYGGPLDQLLHAVHLSSLEINWLGSPTSALPVVLVPLCWQYIGYSMVIFLAGLEGVPENLIEAADLDGASGFQRFRYVTWPLLAPALTINAALTVIGGLNSFTVIYAITGGGPGNATDTITTLMFQDAFQFDRYGYGTAMALLLSVIVSVVAFVQLKVLRRRELVA
jgi:raffinose/stachyose/melibiose transport system permease protein